jgi:hypothetical protein
LSLLVFWFGRVPVVQNRSTLKASARAQAQLLTQVLGRLYARARFERFSQMNLIRYYRFAFTGRFLWRGSGKVEARLRVVA